MRKRFVFDCETNGLLETVSRVHLIIMWDLDTKEMLVFRENEAEKAVKLLENAELLIGHNIIAYDIPMLEKLFPWFSPQGLIRDTLVISRLVCSNIKESDFNRFRKGTLPGKLIGRHSVEAWGYRLGEHKGDFGKSSETDDETDIWAEWSQEMEDYGIQDVHVSVKIWDYVMQLVTKQNWPNEAIKAEHRFADLAARIERNGYPFDEERAKVLYQDLLDKKSLLVNKLQAQFVPWYVGKWKKDTKAWSTDSAVVTIPNKTLNYKDPLKASRTEGAPFCEIHMKEFNPGSRDMIADRLQKLFSWIPKEFTETGKPKVNEDVLKDLVGEDDDEDLEESEDVLYERLVTKIPQAKDLADYLLIAKRIGQLAEGKNGWLKLVRNGKVHGTMNTLGARTSRVTHARPNMSQCPAVRSPYGYEFRDLWTTTVLSSEWVIVGTDLSGIEIRCFANELAPLDDGEYSRIVIEGDVHSKNMEFFSVPTRDNAKTALYCLIYGGGDAKLGSVVNGTSGQGREMKQSFMRNVPAYKKLNRDLVRVAERNGWISAIDGRRIYVDFPHKTLNMRLQSAGALIAKHWANQIEEDLIDSGLEHGWHGDFAYLGFFHDELGIAVRVPGLKNDYIDTFDYSIFDSELDLDKRKKKIKSKKEQNKFDWYLKNPILKKVNGVIKDAIKKTEEHYGFTCPLDCDVKIGTSWAQVH